MRVFWSLAGWLFFLLAVTSFYAAVAASPDALVRVEANKITALIIHTPWFLWLGLMMGCYALAFLADIAKSMR
ncbi:MAG: hypothetical protein J2P48_12755 [Alphaproteobacteria bacterium]|nr:hypothetical protein [Alphaproteobacteria bacterium]